MSELLDLHATPDGVKGSVRQGDRVEGIDNLGGCGQHRGVDGGVGGRHVERAVSDAQPPVDSLIGHPLGHVDVVARGQDVDDLVVLHVTDRGGVTGALLAQAHEVRLVESDGAGPREALGVGRQEGAPVGEDGVIDGVPLTGELRGDLLDRATGSHLLGRPFGRPGREQALLGGDSVILQHPARHRTGALRAAHPVLSPGEFHWFGENRQIDVGDDRAILHPRDAPARRAADLGEDLFNDEREVGTAALVGENANVLQSHQGLDDLTRVGDDEGASGLLDHTSSLRHLRPFRKDL